MRSLVISVIVAVAVPSVGTVVASAMPIDGAAIARVGQQLNTVLDIKAKAKKPKTRTSAPAPPPPRQPSESY